MSIPIGQYIVISLLILGVILIIWYNCSASKRGEIVKRSEIDDMIKETIRLEASNRLLSRVQLSTNKICISKYDTLLNEIRRVEGTVTARPNKIISDPRKQLNTIIDHMISCIAAISELSETQFRTRVAYRFKDGDWDWIDGYSSSGYFTLQNLLTTENTTFQHITRKDAHRESFIFFNTKSLAVKNSKYVYEPHRDFDENDSVIDGSILAKSLFVGRNLQETYAELAIFIDTTDGQLIIKDDSKESIKFAKQQFKDKIFSVYEERLKVELALLYLDHLKHLNSRSISRRTVSPVLIGNAINSSSDT